MDVFDLRRHIVDDYARFARSFTRIKAADLKQQVDQIYNDDQFWPEPLINYFHEFKRSSTLVMLGTISIFPSSER